MALPAELQDVKSLKKRFDKAFERESYWRDLLDDVYEYFLPQRNLFNEDHEGSKKMDRIYDSTAMEAIQEGASKLQANIAPIWKRWARAEMSDAIKRAVEQQQDVTEEQIQENLDKQSEIAFDYINRSNFSTQFYEMILDLLIGTGTLRIDEEDSFDEPLSFHAIPPKGIAYEEGPKGTIETHWRKFKVAARNLERMWRGFKPSPEMSDIIRDKPDCMVDVCEGVVFYPAESKYYGVVWVKGEDRLSWDMDYDVSSPWVTGRYAKASGEVRGRGPALYVYPDVRSLNKVMEFGLQKTALDIAGMYTVVDDGVFNPYTFTVSPGMAIPVSTNSRDNPSLQRLDTSTNLQLAEFQIGEMKAAIKKALFNDLRAPDAPVRSATEVAIEAQELARRIGSAFGRLQTEILVPILKRVFYILQKKGLINVNLNNFATTVKFTSPLAAAQDQEDLMAIEQAVAFTMNTAGPQAVMTDFKVEDFGSFAAKKTGMPQELVRSESEKKNILEAAGQASREMMAQGQVPPVEGGPQQ